jgi:hypothetical protein
MSRELDDEPREYASSPCSMHEFDEAGSAGLDALAARLNELLEGERAGTLGLIDMKADRDDALGELLAAVSRDEARFCAMLTRHLSRLGYAPSRATGVFYEKLCQRETLDAKLRLLDRGQSAVVRVLDEILPTVTDPELRDDLAEMRDTHVVNIDKCAAYLSG